MAVAARGRGETNVTRQNREAAEEVESHGQESGRPVVVDGGLNRRDKLDVDEGPGVGQTQEGQIGDKEHHDGAEQPLPSVPSAGQAEGVQHAERSQADTRRERPKIEVRILLKSHKPPRVSKEFSVFVCVQLCDSLGRVVLLDPSPTVLA